MKNTEIVLIALILLIVFMGVQIKNFFLFLKGNASNKEEQKKAIPVKTVLPAQKEAAYNEIKRVAKKTTSKKKTSVKKGVAKKTAQKKTLVKKSGAKKTAQKKTLKETKV